MNLADRVQAAVPAIFETYCALHAAPELSKKEVDTSALIQKQLIAFGYDVTYPFGRYADPAQTCYGVVGLMRNGEGPTVLVRADMDALPVLEETGLEYASKNEGVMHACGHDVHMAVFLGVAQLLAEMKDEWHGTVMLVAQPAEEMVEGAKAMLAAGLYDIARPDYGVAFHDWAVLESGKVGYRAEEFMSATDSLNIIVRGIGGHGGTPQDTKDPVVLSAETISMLQTIVSREVSPLEPAVVTVGKIEGGTKRNIIPDFVTLYLTARTFKPEVRKLVLESLERIPRGLAIAAGAPPPTIEYIGTESISATYNDPALTVRMAAAIGAEIGAENVVEVAQATVSEDFGLFGLSGEIPTLLLALGAADPAKLAANTQPGLHSNHFAPYEPELVLNIGMRAMTAGVLDLLAG